MKTSQTHWSGDQDNTLIKYCFKNYGIGQFRNRISWTNWPTDGIQDIDKNAAKCHLKRKGLSSKQVTKAILKTMIVADDDVVSEPR